MLVLSRKTGQRAVIAGNIQVVVLGVQGDRVKLGFEGPGDVPIHRAEVLQRITQAAVSVPVGHATECGLTAPDIPKGVSEGQLFAPLSRRRESHHDQTALSHR